MTELVEQIKAMKETVPKASLQPSPATKPETTSLSTSTKADQINSPASQSVSQFIFGGGLKTLGGGLKGGSKIIY